MLFSTYITGLSQEYILLGGLTATYHLSTLHYSLPSFIGRPIAILSLIIRKRALIIDL